MASEALNCEKFFEGFGWEDPIEFRNYGMNYFSYICAAYFLNKDPGSDQFWASPAQIVALTERLMPNPTQEQKVMLWQAIATKRGF